MLMTVSKIFTVNIVKVACFSWVLKPTKFSHHTLLINMQAYIIFHKDILYYYLCMCNVIFSNMCRK